MKGKPTEWTPEMIEKLEGEFPNRFSIDIAKELGLSIRTIIRKARGLGLKKEPSFLENKREQIQARAKKNMPPNPNKGNKDFRIPNSERFQFKKGQPRPKVDYQKISVTRHKLIEKEKLRLKYGLPQKTKLKLVNIY